MRGKVRDKDREGERERDRERESVRDRDKKERKNTVCVRIENFIVKNIDTTQQFACLID